MAIQNVKEIRHLSGATFQVGLSCGHWISKHLPDPRQLPGKIRCTKCVIEAANRY